MAKKNELRTLRSGTVINTTSKKQETTVIRALLRVINELHREFDAKITLKHHKQWLLRDIVSELRAIYPGDAFHYYFETSAIRPDGGVLYLQANTASDITYPILIVEVKNQGTNDLRAREGKPKQAQGNAIERLVKTSSDYAPR